MADILLEVCVDDVAGLEAAIEGGADRIELCSALALGGLTPSPGLMSLAGRSPVPCYAMIRPRAGDFVYTSQELAIMEEDILFAATSGISGIVFGCNHPDGRLDEAALTRLSQLVSSMPRTLHRSFDLVPDLAPAIELAVGCGFERILTAGRARTVCEGMEDLKTSIKLAAGRLSVMPGSGVNFDTIEVLLATLDVKEVHSSCSASTDTSHPSVAAFGFSLPGQKRTNADLVRKMKARLSAAKL